MRRLLARCASRKLRCFPPNLQNGCSAFTAPAPCVQRLPIPPARVTTATAPDANSVEAETFDVKTFEVSETSKVYHVLGPRIPDIGAGRQAILRQTDAAIAQRGPNLLVLHAVEAVFGQDCLQAAAAGLILACSGQQPVEEDRHHAGEIGMCATGRAETIQIHRGGPAQAATDRGAATRARSWRSSRGA